MTIHMHQHVDAMQGANAMQLAQSPNVGVASIRLAGFEDATREEANASAQRWKISLPAPAVAMCEEALAYARECFGQT